MEKLEVLYLLLNIIEVTLCISIGIYLLFFTTKKVTYLAWFLLVYGLGDISYTFLLFYDDDTFSSIKLLPFAFAYLHTSLLYAYVDSLIVQRSSKRRIRVVLFGVLFFLFGIFIILFSILKASGHSFFQKSLDWYIMGCLIYFFFIYTIAVIQIIRHRKLIKEQYSNIENRELTWLLYLLLTAVVFVSVGFAFLLRVSGQSIEFILDIFNIIWILSITYTGLYYQNSEDFFGTIKSNSIVVEAKTHNTELFKKVCDLIKEKQLFLKPELTILDVANAVGEHQKLISQAINTEKKLNFNSYINSLRIEYSMKLLKDNNHQYLSIEGIGENSGFKSNSAFYRAFKKHVNTTPLQFQKENSL